MNSYTHTYVGLPVMKKPSESKNMNPLQICSGSSSQKPLNNKPNVPASPKSKFKDLRLQLQEKVAIVSAIM